MSPERENSAIETPTTAEVPQVSRIPDFSRQKFASFLPGKSGYSPPAESQITKKT